MTFTYLSSDLSTDLAKVRLYIGDTDSSAPIFTDEEINSTLALQTDLTLAAAALCDQAAAKYARKVAIGGLSASKAAQQMFEHYRQLAKDLRAYGPGDVPGGTGSRAGGIRVTGVLESDVTNARKSTTYTQGPFRVGQDDRYSGATLNRDDDDC